MRDILLSFSHTGVLCGGIKRLFMGIMCQVIASFLGMCLWFVHWRCIWLLWHGRGMEVTNIICLIAMSVWLAEVDGGFAELCMGSCAMCITRQD
jgi:hypothetical protein